MQIRKLNMIAHTTGAEYYLAMHVRYAERARIAASQIDMLASPYTRNEQRRVAKNFGSTARSYLKDYLAVRSKTPIY